MAAWPLLTDHNMFDAAAWPPVIEQLEALPPSEGRDEQLQWAREWYELTKPDLPKNSPAEVDRASSGLDWHF